VCGIRGADLGATALSAPLCRDTSGGLGGGCVTVENVVTAA